MPDKIPQKKNFNLLRKNSWIKNTLANVQMQFQIRF